MNILTLIAGIVALLAAVGHFTIGKKEYLLPVLDSNIEEIPKKVMHSLFHYMSVYMVLSTIFLTATSLGICQLFESYNDIVRLIGFIYCGFGITQFIIALTSKIDNGLFKMFQWIFWFAIGILSILGSY